MKAGLQLRMSQQLTLTPQLQQSIRLLQLSTLELNQEIEQALQDNPLLERDDDPASAHLRLSADGSIHEVVTPVSATEEASAETGMGSEVAATEGDAGYDDVEGGDTSLWSATRRATGDDDNEERPQDWASATVSLRDHLRTQMVSTVQSDRDRALLSMLIDAVDDNGYLGVTLEELQALCEDEGVELDELQIALSLLQSFDPPGVAARDVAECMRLQLDIKLADDPEPEERDALCLARRIVTDHLPLLAARDFARLRKVLGVDDEQLRSAHQEIRGLVPRPGVGFGHETADYVVPDILVRRVQDRWVAKLNPDVMPRLRVNREYASILKHDVSRSAPLAPATTTMGEGAVTPAGDWSTRLQDARWLIRNLRQRFITIERVAQAVVDRQSRFFTYGAIAMRPLVLREIAATLGLHESTISRVTSNKFMATPYGVFELRYFFGSHLATETGGEASSTAIRALIRQLIDAENGKAPLSDSRITEMLAEQGMVVARRTVAKYRELMHIPAASLRKGL